MAGDDPTSVSMRPDGGIRARAEELERLRGDLHRLFAARDGTEQASRAWKAAVVALNKALRSFYQPFDDLGSRIRGGDQAAIDDAVRFLEADPWCFRSGYLKAGLMRSLANCELRDRTKDRLRAVVVHRLLNPEPLLLRPVSQLAHNVWDEDLALQVTALVENGTTRQRQDTRSLLRAVEHKRRTVAGARAKDRCLPGRIPRD